MAFQEKLKLELKKKAHFSCCLCHEIGVEIHHIIPQATGGEDRENNAAPLCPSCHETYGANQEKQKFIREARDFWYELCAKRYATDPDRLDQISEMIKGVATKADLDLVIQKINELMLASASQETRPLKQRTQEVARLGTLLAPGVSANRHCKNCGTKIGLYVGDQGHCPNCGVPW